LQNKPAGVNRASNRRTTSSLARAASRRAPIGFGKRIVTIEIRRRGALCCAYQ